MLKFLLAALLAALPFAAPAPATAEIVCNLTQPARVFERLGDMPELIQAEVRAYLGEIAEPGGPFNPTDVVDERPSRRFIRGLHSRGIWFVWYEHGGLGFHHHTLAYSIGISGLRGHQVPMAGRRGNLVGDPCRATQAMLDGVYAASMDEH